MTLVLETGKRLRAKAQGIIGPQHRDAGAEQTPARRVVGWWGGVSGVGECGPGSLLHRCAACWMKLGSTEVLLELGERTVAAAVLCTLFWRINKPFFWLPFTIFKKERWDKASLGYF